MNSHLLARPVLWPLFVYPVVLPAENYDLMHHIATSVKAVLNIIFLIQAVILVPVIKAFQCLNIRVATQLSLLSFKILAGEDLSCS